MTRTRKVDTPRFEVRPPELHPGQREVMADPSRFKLLRAGRRWRKSGFGVVVAFTGYQAPDRYYHGALTGGQIGWWVPSLTARYLVTDWHPIRALAGQIPGARIEEANHRVIMPNGGSILMLSGDNIDSGRGLGLDGAVLDEATLLPEQLWTETIQATLIDRLGWALFLYTPKGLDWVYQLDQTMRDDPDWRAFHYRSVDNPFVPPSEIERLGKTMSTVVRRQELEAEYVAGGAGVFQASWIRHYFTRFDGEQRIFVLGDEAVPASRCWFFHTVDLAWTQTEHADFTVISTWAVTPKRHLILADCTRGHFEGPDIVPRLQFAYEKWGGHLAVERATRQMGIIQEAVRQGLPVREVKAEKDKQARALPAQARMEQGTIWFPPASTEWYPVLEDELLAFPAGRHDDFVDTLAYAVLQVARGGQEEGIRFL